MNRRGIALAAAMLSLLLGGMLAALILSAARVQWLAGHRQLAARVALAAAEGTASWEFVHWDSASASQPVGQMVPLASPVLPGPLRSQAQLLRLGTGLYLVRAVVEVTDQAGGVLARDGVARLVGERPDSLAGENRINRVAAGSWWRWP